MSDLQKHFLRSRWLNQVSWMEGRAKTTQRRYYALHLTIIIGGVIIPALVSLNLSGTRAAVVDWGTFALSLVVAISAAVEPAPDQQSANGTTGSTTQSYDLVLVTFRALFLEELLQRPCRKSRVAA